MRHTYVVPLVTSLFIGAGLFAFFVSIKEEKNSLHPIPEPTTVSSSVLPVITTSPNPTSTSFPLSHPIDINDWKTYTNVTNGYTMKYPSQLVYETYSNGDVRFFLLGDKGRKDTPTGFGQHLAIFSRTGSPEEAVKNELPGVPYREIYEEGMYGIQVIKSGDMDLFYAPTKQSTRSIRITYLPVREINTISEIKIFESVFNKMVASVQFTK